MKINKKGFTLVELLVVIAIIGILSTVAVVNLNSARDKAKLASVQGNLAGIMPSIVMCNDDALAINYSGTSACGGAVGDTPVAGATLCTTGGNWPTLPTGWSYMDLCDNVVAAGTFTYGATDSTNTVTCNQDGCKTT